MSASTLPIENEVLIGQEGWLYLYGGSNLVGEVFARPSAMLEDHGARWLSVLTSRKALINALGAEYFHFWAPDKLAVYPEFVPLEYVLPPQTPAQFLTDSYSDDDRRIVIDLLPAFFSGKAKNLLYWKTDTHWTYEGACVAYEAICKRLGARPLQGLWGRPRAHVEIGLDLGAKLTPPRKETCHFAHVLMNSKIVEKNELVKFLELLVPKYHSEMHIGTSVTFKNSTANRDPRKVLIFGDSFCEYRPNSLTALLAETFQDVMFVWSVDLDFELIRRYKPDIVLSEMAERFLRRVPLDVFNLEKAAFQKITNFLNKKCLVGGKSTARWTFSEGGPAA